MFKDSDLSLCVLEIPFSALFDQTFQDVGIKTNGGDAEILSTLFDIAVKYEQMPPIPKLK
ncbi:hypothetical protein ACMYSQ_012273 [Aspergillus niger]